MYSKHNLGCTHTEPSIGLIADVDTNVFYLKLIYLFIIIIIYFFKYFT